ncbi:glutathione S-transferase N-terminal domain-containing protein [Candidatus Woesearchaeota archaeon]|nr:glutathione S-transferase N-terminal domain-containing protein [Candidatus Woesearchaeota archaeon]
MKVVIYTIPTCPWCKKTKQFLKKNKIKFKNINVSKNLVKKNEMIRKSGQEGVPVIDIDGKIIVGYDEKELKKLLKL